MYSIINGAEITWKTPLAKFHEVFGKCVFMTDAQEMIKYRASWPIKNRICKSCGRLQIRSIINEKAKS